MEPSLSIDWTLESPGRLRVAGAGTLDKNGGGEFAHAVSDALLTDVRVVVLDLGAVDRLDPDGLRLLLYVRELTVAAGVRCEVVGAPPLLDHLLHLMSLRAGEPSAPQA